VESDSADADTLNQPLDFHAVLNRFHLMFTQVNVIHESDDEGQDWGFVDDNEDEPYVVWALWTGDMVRLGVTDNGSELNSGESHMFTQGTVFGPQRPGDDGLFVEAIAMEKDGGGNPRDSLMSAIDNFGSAATSAVGSNWVEFGKELAYGLVDLYTFLTMDRDGDDYMGGFQVDYRAETLRNLVATQPNGFPVEGSTLVGQGCQWRIRWRLHRVPAPSDPPPAQ